MHTYRLKRQRVFIRVGFAMAALLLAIYWLLAIEAIVQGRLFAYVTYWYQPVWTILLLIVLAVLTPFWFWALFRFWNYAGDRPEDL